MILSYSNRKENMLCTSFHQLSCKPSHLIYFGQETLTLKLNNCLMQFSQLFASAHLVSKPKYAGQTIITYWTHNLVHLPSLRGAYKAFKDSVLDYGFCSNYSCFENTVMNLLNWNAVWDIRQSFYSHKLFNLIHNLILKWIIYCRSQ